MSTIQLILIGLGVLLALGAYGPVIAKFIASKFKKTSPTINFPLPPQIEKIDYPSVTGELIRVEGVSTEFADIVIQWEKLADMLIKADMKDSAKELKDLLVNMAQEYKTDVTVAPVKKEAASLFAIQSLMS